MEKNLFRKSIIDKIKNDPNNLGKYLRATGLSFWGSDNLGIINTDDFLSYLYKETDFATEKKNEIFRYINESFDKNTFFIVGYPGCGKTTFVTALLNYCKQKGVVNEIEITHCDAIATSAELKPLIESFRVQIMDYLKRHGQNSLNLFIDFYNKNNDVFAFTFANYDKIYDLQYTIKKEFTNTNKRHLEKDDDRMFFRRNILEKLDFKELFYFYCFLHISNHFDDITYNKPIILVIDNVDYFDDFNDLNSFMKSINDFTLDMNRDMENLFLYRNTNEKFRYVDKFKLIITMRETTKANIQNEHWANILRDAYTYYDISEWYEKDEIIKHRLDFLNADEISNSNIKEKIKFMRLILRDIDIQKVTEKDIIFALYNNDYRVAVNSLSRIISQHINCLSEYESIMNLPYSARSLIYGARGMLVRWICDEFILKQGNKENYFQKIGAIGFQNRKSNEVSVSRLILSYLSNRTDTKCDDMQNCIPFIDIINDFKDIFDEDTVKMSIKNMYNLRNARSWSHLISFSQLERSDKDRPIGAFENIDFENTTLHYSCAGKIYLEFNPHCACVLPLSKKNG